MVAPFPCLTAAMLSVCLIMGEMCQYRTGKEIGD